jgi:hypothetical protein
MTPERANAARLRGMSGCVELHEGWTRVSSSGPGPFVTTEIVRAPDGSERRWESRRHRKQSPARRRGTDEDRRTDESVWWRPHRRERIDWLATLVQLIGTFLFNISTFTALDHNLTTEQTNARVWAPDAFGSIAFLIASELAFAEVCHRWISFRNRTLTWKIVALNLLGSIAFGASAIASLVEPASGEPVSARIANAGTSVGGICFLLGALLLMPEAANEERAATGAAPRDSDLAPASSRTQ